MKRVAVTGGNSLRRLRMLDIKYSSEADRNSTELTHNIDKVEKALSMVDFHPAAKLEAEAFSNNVVTVKISTKGWCEWRRIEPEFTLDDTIRLFKRNNDRVNMLKDELL